jgi:DNA-binding NarL/FixJ family response regulator
VLFLDGEMPANALQERFAAAVAGGESEPSAELLHVVTPDLQPGIMPDLATAQGQEAIDEVIERLKTEVIIVDNLSAWVRGTGRENEAESWQPVAGWALRHRHAGRSILFVHHAGKGGAQRGTSKKEDLLDTVICLKRPPDYLPADGAVFEVHFEKARALYGSEAEGFEARLTIDNQGRQLWTCRTLETSTSDRVVELANSGLTQKEIAEELGINKSTVCRHYNRAQTEGRIDARRRTG